MRVIITMPVELQDAGRVLRLDAGSSHALAEAVALGLIAQGRAVAAPPGPEETEPRPLRRTRRRHGAVMETGAMVGAPATTEMF
jgi:hypothetical protein